MMNEPYSELLYFNGINGATGDYGLPPMTGEQLSGFIQGEARPENLAELKFRFQTSGQEHFGVKEGVDPKKLDKSGWGVIFAYNGDPAIQEALSELLQLRRQQAGDYFRIYARGDGYRPNESKTDFLARHKMGPGPVDPAKVPYYLLIVGSPEAIPFQFQFQLDVQYAVGRIWFATVQEYANYAHSVVIAETGKVQQLPRQVSFFGVANDEDKATTLSTEQLVNPLFNYLAAGKPDWSVSAQIGEHATKAQLTRLLGGADTPALLFTASHGMEFPLGDPRQLPHQGALLCQDWPGPNAWKGHGPIPQDFYFAGEDLSDDARLLGLVSFHFACYGAGTPLNDEFSKQAFKERKAIAPHPFLAGLPTKLLSHPKGGALAVIGHVERAWGYSFLWPDAGRQTTVFESTLERLLDAYPVGAALEYFNERYAELSSDLSTELEEIEYGKTTNPYKLAGMWTSNNDARSYVIIGDPAVRLPVAPAGQSAKERPAMDLNPVFVSTSPNTSAEVEFSLPVTEEKALDDEVHFSAFHPRTISPNTWHKLLVYAHLDSALSEIATDAGQILGKAAREYRQAQASATIGIAKGTEITLVPQAEGLVFQPPQARLVWSDDWQRADFEMQATGLRVGHVIEGSIACYVGPLLIADIRLPVVVTSPNETVEGLPPSQDIQTAKMYQAVFASYSHADTAIVEAVEKAYKALGMDYLRDVMTLKSGQNWSDELLNMIDRADIFQLFWSSSASQSTYVEQEWRHALALKSKKGPAFIRPVYWEKTVPFVPDALSSIHFAPVAFAGLAEPLPTSTAAVGKPALSEQIAPKIGPSETPTAVLPQLAALLPKVDEDIKSLTVSTYATADPVNPGEASLKAQTHFSLTGEVKTFISSTLTAEEERYLQVHQTMVKEALNARIAYLKLITQIDLGQTREPER